MTANYLIRTLYSPESSLSISFFKTNLSLSFCPQPTGNYRRENKRYLSTTISDDTAAVLLNFCKSILRGELTSMSYTIECNNHTYLHFECMADDRGSNRVAIIIEKNRDRIPFTFKISECRILKNGREQMEHIQSGLIVFTKVLEAYLTAIANERQFSVCYDDEY
jgi:hypothetical protein